jgi:NAD(P)-dependent dehydrogenase (short-subunit alcohol dehydrogenase family)
LLERYPQQPVLGRADLTFLADRRKVLAAAEAIGGINLLINAAGVNHFAMLEQLDDNDINAMLALNITAPICLTKLLPLLKQAPAPWWSTSAPPTAPSATPATPAIAPPSSPCAVFSKRCAGSWRTPGSVCCTSPRAPPAPA